MFVPLGAANGDGRRRTLSWTARKSTSSESNSQTSVTFHSALVSGSGRSQLLPTTLKCAPFEWEVRGPAEATNETLKPGECYLPPRSTHQRWLLLVLAAAACNSFLGVRSSD